ncbi:MAG TPA: hypothetical protein VMU77_01905 [Acidimicrobiales bacterium]|nr:hypothetical protein [Acidimicrobiales bacterium]
MGTYPLRVVSGYIPFDASELVSEHVVPRQASTIMVVRDNSTSGELEVLVLRKSANAGFAGGAYVFPGGALEDDDGSDFQFFGQCLDDKSASQLLGVDEGGLAFWIAAVRECYEESGILFAYGQDGQMISFEDPDTEQRFSEQRAAMNGGRVTLAELCRSENLVLATDRLHYFSHWITPEGAPKRFDTRFFLAEAPAGQSAADDGSEIVASTWISPEGALKRGESGDFQLIYPTIKSLEAISRFDKVADLIAAAASSRPVGANEPRVFVEGREVRILLPGDPGYDEQGQ